MNTVCVVGGFHCTDVGPPLACMQMRKRHICLSGLGPGLGRTAWDGVQAPLSPTRQLCAGTAAHLHVAAPRPRRGGSQEMVGGGLNPPSPHFSDTDNNIFLIQDKLPTCPFPIRIQSDLNFFPLQNSGSATKLWKGFSILFPSASNLPIWKGLAQISQGIFFLYHFHFLTTPQLLIFVTMSFLHWLKIFVVGN